MMLRKDEIEEKNRYIDYQKTVSYTLPQTTCFAVGSGKL